VSGVLGLRIAPVLVVVAGVAISVSARTVMGEAT
jgi:hypothetical protein